MIVQKQLIKKDPKTELLIQNSHENLIMVDSSDQIENFTQIDTSHKNQIPFEHQHPIIGNHDFYGA